MTVPRPAIKASHANKKFEMEGVAEKCAQSTCVVEYCSRWTCCGGVLALNGTFPIILRPFVLHFDESLVIE
jgi:hypothetical protein